MQDSCRDKKYKNTLLSDWKSPNQKKNKSKNEPTHKFEWKFEADFKVKFLKNEADFFIKLSKYKKIVSFHKI